MITPDISSADARPNIVLIFTDQQTRSAMSITGNTALRTPHLDALARGGMRFDLSYCAAPVCGPARASLVTGLPPCRTGVVWNGNRLTAGLPTLGELFRKGGYETVWAGKWHLPESYVRTPDGIPGFENLVAPESHPLMHRTLPYGWPGFALGANTDTLFVDEAIRFLERPHAKPFLLCVSLHNPHDICWWIRQKPLPTLAPQPPLPANFNPAAGEPAFLQECRTRTHYGNENNWTPSWTDEEWRSYLSAYYRMTEQVDHEVGRLLVALDRHSPSNRTLIAFTSDHGEGMAAHHWVTKLSFSEEVMRVPLILKGPSIPANTVDSTHLTGTTDLLPTLCEAAGIPAPATFGLSLLPLARGQAGTWREYWVAELAPDDQRPAMQGRMVRSSRYKYCLYQGTTREETLFDLHTDPGELRNLARDGHHQQVLETHRTWLAQWQQAAGDTLPVP